VTVNGWLFTVMVVCRVDVAWLAATEYETPVALVDVIVTQSAPLDAVHVQFACVVTANELLPPPAGKFCDVGLRL
jgi:hypothetical protein